MGRRGAGGGRGRGGRPGPACRPALRHRQRFQHRVMIGRRVPVGPEEARMHKPRMAGLYHVAEVGLLQRNLPELDNGLQTMVLVLRALVLYEEVVTCEDC